MKKSTRKKGFTIVELVIVIAVIAILAAVLIPTFSNVISNANEVTAKENARNEWVSYLATIADDGSEIGDYVVLVKSGTDAKYIFVVEDGQFNSEGYEIGSTATALTLSDGTNTWTVSYDSSLTVKKDSSTATTTKKNTSDTVEIYSVSYPTEE